MVARTDDHSSQLQTDKLSAWQREKVDVHLRYLPSTSKWSTQIAAADRIFEYVTNASVTTPSLGQILAEVHLLCHADVGYGLVWRRVCDAIRKDLLQSTNAVHSHCKWLTKELHDPKRVSAATMLLFGIDPQHAFFVVLPCVRNGRVEKRAFLRAVYLSRGRLLGLPRQFRPALLEVLRASLADAELCESCMWLMSSLGPSPSELLDDLAHTAFETLLAAMCKKSKSPDGLGQIRDAIRSAPMYALASTLRRILFDGVESHAQRWLACTVVEWLIGTNVARQEFAKQILDHRHWDGLDFLPKYIYEPHGVSLACAREQEYLERRAREWHALPEEALQFNLRRLLSDDELRPWKPTIGAFQFLKAYALSDVSDLQRALSLVAIAACPADVITAHQKCDADLVAKVANSGSPIVSTALHSLRCSTAVLVHGRAKSCATFIDAFAAEDVRLILSQVQVELEGLACVLCSNSSPLLDAEELLARFHFRIISSSSRINKVRSLFERGEHLSYLRSALKKAWINESKKESRRWMSRLDEGLDTGHFADVTRDDPTNNLLHELPCFDLACVLWKEGYGIKWHDLAQLTGYSVDVIRNSKRRLKAKITRA